MIYNHKQIGSNKLFYASINEVINNLYFLLMDIQKSDSHLALLDFMNELFRL